jgi:NAD(P)-dependent dehydrogenase (short-subunit alcohol dehydrogenase family)
MNLQDKIVVITGGASGIGLALGQRFRQAGAQVVLADLHLAAAHAEAAKIGAWALEVNVGREADVARLVEDVLARFGRIDLFCSNAGIVVPGGEEAPADQWKLIYDVNVLAHVCAAKYVLPGMLERGEGYLLNTASAAGLLTEFHSAPYAVSKHAAVGFAEWLAITYGPRGIRVSVLCPAGVRTPMAENIPSLMKDAISPEALAEQVLQAIDAEQFLISTHAFVLPLFQLKANDYDRYLALMREQRAAAEATDARRLMAQSVQ